MEVEPSIIHFRLVKETLYEGLMRGRGRGLRTTVEKRSVHGIIELHAQHLLQKQSVLHNIVQVMKALKEMYTNYFGVAKLENIPYRGACSFIFAHGTSLRRGLGCQIETLPALLTPK